MAFLILSLISGPYLLIEQNSLGLICCILFFLLLADYRSLAESILVDQDGISLDAHRVAWDEVTKVEFRISGIRDYTNQVIEITQANECKWLIKPRYYNDSSTLRQTVKQIVQAKGIDIKVEDRGA